MENTKRNCIYALKGLAIISVVYAHCNNRVSIGEVDALLENLRLSFGAVGVPIFFVLAGYLFHNQEKIGRFIKKKSQILFQWTFWGILIWSYYALRKGFDYAKPLEWLLGIGNYLWYMRCLVIFWLLYYFVKSKRVKWFLLCVFLLTRILIYDLGFFSWIQAKFYLDELFCQIPFLPLVYVLKPWI